MLEKHECKTNMGSEIQTHGKPKHLNTRELFRSIVLKGLDTTLDVSNRCSFSIPLSVSSKAKYLPCIINFILLNTFHCLLFESVFVFEGDLGL